MVLALVLSALVAALSVAVWRLNSAIRDTRAAWLAERTQREQLEARVAREQATREALSLELARIRAGQSSSGAQGPPTLTLQPVARREATPPASTMTAPAPAQTIELRLVLPRGENPTRGIYEFTVRDWVTGEVRLTRGGLKARAIDGGRAVTAYVAGDVFVSGSHEVILRSGSSEIAAYEVTVR